VIGPAGATGLQGAAGATGSQGAQGPQGPSGTTAAPSDYSFYYGTGFKAPVGTTEVGGSLDRNQIDMSNATSARFVITMGTAALASGSCALKLFCTVLHIVMNRLISFVFFC
jgi:hypothetical protein